MSNWLPDLSGRTGPKYRAIVDCLAADLAAGRLRPGMRLPTHRDLAWRLKVTVGTVARAYAEAERRGLLSGEVGRGSFVTDPAQAGDPALARYLSAAWVPRPDIINMAVNRPDGDQGAWAVGPVLERLGRRPDLAHLLSYNLEPVLARQRAAAKAWLNFERVDAPEETIAVIGGSQQAMVAALAACTSEGDVVAAEHYTYPGFKSAASLLGRPLVAVAMDEQGLIPDEVERAFAKGARLLFLTATVQNPLTMTLPADRRRAIAAAARRHDAFIIEDGLHRFLYPDAPEPVWVHAPERCVYVSTLSKSVSPGLRTAFAVIPPALKPRFDAAVGALTLAQSAVLLEAASILIEEGQAFEAAARQRAEAAARVALAAPILGVSPPLGGTAFSLWLPMPAGWRSGAFAAEAARLGVTLAPTEAFAVGRPPLDGVRVSLTAAPDRATLERGARLLAGLLRVSPDQAGMTI